MPEILSFPDFLKQNKDTRYLVYTGDLVKYLNNMDGLDSEQKNKILGYIGYLSQNGITQEEHKAILDSIDFYKRGVKQVAKKEKANLRKDLEKDISDNKYVEYLEKVGLTGNALEIGITLIYKSGIDINKSNRDIIIRRLSLLVNFIIEVESDRKNKSNKWSSAKGYFQYLNGDGGDRKKGEYSSFESGLRRAYIYYTDSINVPTTRFNNTKVPKWVETAYNKPGYDPRDLTAEQQVSLFLIDIFNKPGTSKHIENILINGNLWSLRRLYEDNHHTSKDRHTTPETEKRLNKYIALYQNKFELLNYVQYAKL
ncbi:MAG: hypothetical protein PHH06_01470 [Candidatus Gracilibacteria bacterium]|nr:hypothetical protein [Candidatus Gracilibacteria bacterium]